MGEALIVASVRKHNSPANRRAWRRVPANAASMRGLRDAMAALYDPTPGPVGDDAVAQREQLHREASTGQGTLPLRDAK